jgi:teichuronic acid biosynthesis glycosyltransferase TuaH
MNSHKKILYLMHVPWGWIKQRPHFLAEYLSKDFEVDVYYKKPTKVSKKNLQTRKENTLFNLSIKGFRIIPFEKISLLKYLKLEWINKFILYLQLPSFKNYDYIWISDASLYDKVNFLLKENNKIIYDCMDDIVEFITAKNNPFYKESLLRSEKKLVKDSYKIFCSSNYLKDKILSRTKVNRNIFVVNNAIELPATDNDVIPNLICEKIDYIKKLSNPIMYVGTISEWFDFDLIISILNEYKGINAILIGPSDIKIPTHDRIHYLGTIERKYIFNVMSHAWVLAMPFIVNELIKSVNPVKLYEYIYMAKQPIIAPRYEETLKFSPYVHLYDNINEFKTILNEIINHDNVDTTTKQNMRKFALNNTWEKRYLQIKNILNK